MDVDEGVNFSNSMDIKEDDSIDLYKSMDNDFKKATGARKFSYNALIEATNNFSDEQKLGEGAFGAVYKGFLKELNCSIAVKKVSSDSNQGIKEYAYEVKIISQLRHRNVVKLIGWCHENAQLLLVYEFMINGSLDSHLFKQNRLLPWEIRYKIALGFASGLLYLHEEWEKYVVHRDIKASNIMLDSDFTPKIGDFGLARLADHGKGLEYTALAGTIGYVSPEYATTGRATKESDVYSFGIVALEIACGRKIIDRKASEDRMNLREWIWDLYGEGKLLEGVDCRLHGDFDKKEVECLMIVGLWCGHPDENLRPTMEKAIHVLKFLSPFPDLPLKMPLVSYFAPFLTSSSSGSGSSGSSITDFVERKNQAPSFSNFILKEQIGGEENPAPEEKGDQNFVYVYKMELHCEGCGKKVRRFIKDLEGVETVKVDCEANKLTVTGKVNPTLIKSMLEMKCKTRVEIV
ncbi:L-type lectin-domain containing receptor kinase IX.2-like [Euphorbia lathyris]|uniref:L-type lectin-domain containing receptor kinase IX.2-like n=1 Tax=Euphorbia lathyris TaxID=212925 RepID=UPI0033138BA0